MAGAMVLFEVELAIGLVVVLSELLVKDSVESEMVLSEGGGRFNAFGSRSGSFLQPLIKTITNKTIV